MASNIRKKAPKKAYYLHETENTFSPAGMKDAWKNMFSLDVKVTFDGSNL